MPDHKRLKRKVLRQAVEENLEELQGQPRGTLRAKRQRRRTRLRRLALLTGLPALTLGIATLVLTHSPVSGDPIARFTAANAPASQTDANSGPGGAPSDSGAPAAELGLDPSFDPALLSEEALRLPAPETMEASVFSLGVRRIVLDPGHGGENLGTVAPGGLQEKDLTLDISLRAAELLEESGVEVLMTRISDESMGLRDRTALANEAEADLFVSVHVNWIEQREVRGVETFYLGPTNDPYLAELAASENRGTDYTLADFRRLLQGVYAGVRQQESRSLASSIQASLLRSLRQVNPGLRDRGVKTAPFVVLVTSDMPAVLVEVACLSNQEEARLLSKPYYRQFIARALAQGILDYSQSLSPEDAGRGPQDTTRASAAGAASSIQQPGAR
ncbi:MAG: N-acetylmuramoyl-L-alanine amidase [Acidobacteriota bacterium]